MDRTWAHYAKWGKLDKDEYYMISLVCEIWKSKTCKKQSKMAVTRGDVRGRGVVNQRNDVYGYKLVTCSK